MKREPQSLTVHLRHAAHRIHRAAWMIDSGASALHCGRVLAFTRGNTGKILKLFFSDSAAFEDLAKRSSTAVSRVVPRTAKLALKSLHKRDAEFIEPMEYSFHLLKKSGKTDAAAVHELAQPQLSGR